MRVVWWTGPGDPGVLVPGQAPEPRPGPGEVLIDVGYAGVTFVETQLRAGRGPFRWEPPLVPGNGVGGFVADVGPGVDRTWLGCRVVSALSGTGGYAERAVAAVENVLPVPAELELADAVALLADGRTAMLLHRSGRPRAGERVLVEAAAGGVGGLLVQLAAAAGATVVGAAGGSRKAAVAKELGAAAAVDYLDPLWTDEVGPVDVVYDGVGGRIGRAAFELLRPGGRMVVHGMASGEMTEVPEEEAHARGVTVTHGLQATPELLRACTRDALAEAARGVVRPTIGLILPLGRAAEAHAQIERRAVVGKTLLAVRTSAA